MIKNVHNMKKIGGGVGEMTQGLRVLTSHTEEPGLIPRYMAARLTSVSLVLSGLTPFLASSGTRHMCS